MKYTFNIIICIVLSLGCQEPDPNITQSGEDELKSMELDRQLDNRDKTFEDIVYVPIYSDIYTESFTHTSQRH